MFANNCIHFSFNPISRADKRFYVHTVDENGVVGLRSQIQVELDSPDQSTIIVAAIPIKVRDSLPQSKITLMVLCYTKSY